MPIFKLVWLSRQLQWLLSLLAPSPSISWSVFVWRTVHSCPENCPHSPSSPVTPIALQYKPALGWIYNWLRSGSQIKASPGLDIKLAHYYCLRKTVQSIQVRGHYFEETELSLWHHRQIKTRFLMQIEMLKQEIQKAKLQQNVDWQQNAPDILNNKHWNFIMNTQFGDVT